MINFNVADVFPRFILNDTNGYAMAKAIEAALKYFLAKCQEGLDTLQDVDKMPEWRLDECAWESNCLYDYNADVDASADIAAKTIAVDRNRRSVMSFMRGQPPAEFRIHSYFGPVELIKKRIAGSSSNPVYVTTGIIPPSQIALATHDMATNQVCVQIPWFIKSSGVRSTPIVLTERHVASVGHDDLLVRRILHPVNVVQSHCVTRFMGKRFR